MTLPLQTIVLCVPSAKYVLVQRRRGLSWGLALRLVGWRAATFRHLGLGLLFGLIPGILLFAAPTLLPDELAASPNVANTRYSSWAASPTAFLLALAYEAIFVAIGEEAFSAVSWADCSFTDMAFPPAISFTRLCS